MAQKNGKLATVDGAFIAERVKDLAAMYLTRRDDLEVRWQDRGDEWIDGIIEIKGKENPTLLAEPHQENRPAPIQVRGGSRPTY